MTLTVLPAGVKSKKKAAGFIKKSLRFRSSASASLSRTPSAVATSNKIFTISLWAKPSLLVPLSYIWFLDCAGQDFGFYYNASYTAAIQLSGGAKYVTTSQVFRDPAAWYHFVLAVDTTQAIDANRLKFYINGSQVTAFSSAQYPAQNTTFAWNQKGQAQYFGRNSRSGFLYDGYLTEFYSIDGQALDPTSFGKIDASTGVWTAKEYTGTYGTNGFHLNFEDNSTITALGYDSSGNNNHWTPTNISLSGVTYDSMKDVPAPVSTTVGNFATLNPLVHGNSALTNGNLTSAGTTNTPTIIPSSGTYYFEVDGVSKTWTPPAAFPSVAGNYNFGQRPFNNAPPTGFVALNTNNIPTGTVTLTGTFTGNANADGTFVWLNGTPTALTINGNAVVWGTHADKLANGFKVRTAAATHNAAGSNTYVVTTAGNVFREQLAQTNP